MRGVDIRLLGSGNVGATNVGRVLGRRFGVTCFVLDGAKGAIPVLSAGQFHGAIGSAAPLAPADAWGWMLVAVAAIAGHMASVFLRFRGGKGVATSFGAMLALWPLLTIPSIVALIAWAVILRMTRFMSLASLTGAIVLPVLATILAFLRLGPWRQISWPAAAPALGAAVFVAAVVLWKHRSNIARLRAGTEPRVGGSGGAPSQA